MVNTLKQFYGSFPSNCLSVFDHFVGLTLKGLNIFCDGEINTMFPLISAPGAYKILKLLGAALIRGRR